MALSEGIKRGTVELLILTLLQNQDMYGYQLSQELASRSNGLYTLQESSMYPTLYRLVEKGMITDRREKVGQRKVRVYYHLEETGKEYLTALRKEYCAICRGVLSILEITEIKDLEEEYYGDSEEHRQVCAAGRKGIPCTISQKTDKRASKQSI